MTEAEQIVTKLSKDFAILRQFVQGNGSKEGCLAERVSILEIRSKKISTKIGAMPCIDGCLFEKSEAEEDDMKEAKRGFRIGDIANLIQLAVLFLIVYGMFIQ